MFDISPGIALIIMFGFVLVLLFTGLPVAFALGGVGALCVVLIWGLEALSITATSAWAIMDFYLMVAIPCFVFMAVVLQSSGIAENLFGSIRLWFGGVGGGLAMAVVVACTIVAAMTGTMATGTVTMGIIALPIMLRLGYNKSMALGCIMAGGGLGILIPPSLPFIVFGAFAKVSIGKLFLGGIIPGLILSAMYQAYIAVRCYFNPELGPPLPPEERVGFKEKIMSLRSMLLPAVLIMAVLGTIVLGIASTVEAAAAGAAGSVVCAAINRKLSWKMIKEACYATFRINAYVCWIMIGAMCFKAVFTGVGGPELARNFVDGLNVSPLFIVFLMQLSYLFLGMFLDDLSMMMLTIPVYVPIVLALGFDPVWFGVLFLINVDMGALTPPFGFGLFFMKGVAPPEVTMGDLYRSITPFLIMQFIGLMLVLFFPQLALLIPKLVFE